MTREEIKLRQIANQHLIAPLDKLTVVKNLCGVQAQFLGNAIHALKIRCDSWDETTAACGLVKNWTLRGTVHVFAESDLPLFLSCEDGRNYRRNEWTEPSFWNQHADWALTPERQSELSERILAELEKGPKSREALKQCCRDHGMTEGEERSMFHPWGGGIRQLCERGFLNYRVDEQKTFCLAPEFTPLPEAQAQLELARRYFSHYGPATVHDAMYFFRVPGAQVKRWLAQLPVTACQCQGKTYFYIENGNHCGDEVPRCLFLAGFDPLMLGYEKKESLYLRPENMRAIFNLAGIVMPPLLLDGVVAGRWKNKGSTLTVEPFRPLSGEEQTLIRQTAQGLWPDLKKLTMLEK